MVGLRALAILILALAAASCAERSLQQLYVPLGAGARFGYTDQPIGERRFQVTYDAPIETAFTYAGPDGRRAVDAQLARTYDLALLRAAELALANGAPAFQIANRTNDVDVRNYPSYRGPFWRPYWGRPWGYPYGGPYWPYEDDSYETLSSRVTLIVDLLPALEPGAYDARSTLATIRGRYARPSS
jgi:hypothetical protein